MDVYKAICGMGILTAGVMISFTVVGLPVGVPIIIIGCVLFWTSYGEGGGKNPS